MKRDERDAACFDGGKLCFVFDDAVNEIMTPIDTGPSALPRGNFVGVNELMGNPCTDALIEYLWWSRPSRNGFLVELGLQPFGEFGDVGNGTKADLHLDVPALKPGWHGAHAKQIHFVY